MNKKKKLIKKPCSVHFQFLLFKILFFSPSLFILVSKQVNSLYKFLHLILMFFSSYNDICYTLSIVVSESGDYPPRIQVSYIDYGNKHWVSASDLLQLPENLAKHPAQAVLCALAKVLKLFCLKIFFLVILKKSLGTIPYHACHCFSKIYELSNHCLNLIKKKTQNTSFCKITFGKSRYVSKKKIL